MRKVVAVALCAILLTACTSETELPPEPELPPITTPAQSWSFEGLNVQGIGDVCGFQVTGDELEIHPFYNESKHIKVKRLLISEQQFWNTICESCTDAVRDKQQTFELLTLKSGVTYGYFEQDASTAFVFYTDTLPSSYVKGGMTKSCQ